MQKQSVVFIGAHPDDIIMAAGTLLLLKERYQIHDFCLTRGQRGYQLDGLRPDALAKPPRDDIAAIRSEEEAAVCRMLNADLLFFDQMDGELFAGRALCERVAAELQRINPAAVIALWPLVKSDHAAASHIARHALYLADLIWTTELYMPLLYGEDYSCPAPNIYVNISSVLDRKLELARCYQSQFGEHGAAWIAEQSKVHGRYAWCEHAEPFASGLPLLATRWNRKAGCVLLD